MASVPWRRNWVELAGPVSGASFGLALLLLSLQIREAGGAFFGPRFWPQAIGVLLVVVNAYVIVRALVGKREPSEELAAQRPFPRLSGSGLRYWAAAALVIGYPLIVQYMGFLAGSALFLVAFMRALGYRRWPVIVPTAAIFAVSVTYFFTAAVYTPLPLGKGPFYAVSAVFARITR